MIIIYNMYPVRVEVQESIEDSRMDEWVTIAVAQDLFLSHADMFTVIP